MAFPSDVSAGEDILASFINNVISYLVPPGVIAMWSGTLANIPSGWLLCDGNNGTPNLIDKFPKCVATSVTNPGTTGGAHTKTISADNMPSHNHAVSGNGWVHLYYGTGGTNGSGFYGITSVAFEQLAEGYSESPITGYAAISLTSTSSGSGTAFDVRPAYFELAFIMKA